MFLIFDKGSPFGCVDCIPTSVCNFLYYNHMRLQYNTLYWTYFQGELSKGKSCCCRICFQSWSDLINAKNVNHIFPKRIVWGLDRDCNLDCLAWAIFCFCRQSYQSNICHLQYCLAISLITAQQFYLVVNLSAELKCRCIKTDGMIRWCSFCEFKAGVLIFVHTVRSEQIWCPNLSQVFTTILPDRE